MVDISYRNNRLEQEAEDINKLQRSYGNWAPPELIMLRVGQIQAAKNLQDLWQLKQLNFHALMGKDKGCFAIDIKPRGKYRMIFMPLNGEAKDLKTITQVKIIELCTDYHK